MVVRLRVGNPELLDDLLQFLDRRAAPRRSSEAGGRARRQPVPAARPVRLPRDKGGPGSPVHANRPGAALQLP